MLSGHCKASLANSPLHCWNYHSNSKAVANAAIKVYTENGIRKAVLKATTKICSGTEILTNYGLHFNVSERNRQIRFN